MLPYKKEIMDMASKVRFALELATQGFVENKISYMEKALIAEKDVNDIQKNIMNNVVTDSGTKRYQEKDLVMASHIAEVLERIGDECVNLIERMEIKVSEGLLFSDDGMAEYMEVLDSSAESLKMAADTLESGDRALADRVVSNGFHVKELVERYRKTHNERLVKGVCDPRTSNMFFDMLDFTGNIARHSSNAVKALLSVK